LSRDSGMKEKMTAPQGKRGRSIQSRLILLLLFILVPVLAIQAYMYYDTYEARRAAELQANLEFARTIAKAFESFVQDVLHQELAIGLAITSSQPMTPGDITRLLQTSRDYDAVREFTWMNPQGDAIYSSNPAMIGMNYGDRAYFREVADGREWTVGALVTARTTGKPVFGITRGIRDGKGALLGVVVATVIPEKLDARLGVERSKGGGFALIDSKGMLVYRYPAIDATWEERNWLRPYPEFEEALKGKEIATAVYAPFEGKNRLVGFAPVPSIGWAASAGKREEDVTGPILIDLTKSSLLFLSISLAAFFLALAVSRKIASPVQALRAHALALGHGEEPGQVRINHVAEFQDLAEAFNTMAGKVRAREAALRESEERLRFALETIHTGAWDLDLVDHTAFRSLEHDRIFGYAELLPQWTYEMFLDHVLAEDRTEVDAKFRQATETRSDWSFECRIRRTDGEVRWILAAGCHRADEVGDLRSMAGIVQDITERKQAEAELQKLAAVVRHSNEFINIATLDGKMIFINDAGAEMVGLSAEEVGHTHILQVVPGHLQDKVNNEVLPALKEKGFWEDELQYLNLKTGRLTDVHATTFTVKDPATGTPIFLANTSIDITERKRAEDALRASEARFKVIASSTPDHILVQDRDLKYTLVVNPQLGLTEQDMIGKTDRDFLTREDAEKLTRIKQQVLETGDSVHVEAPLTTAEGELQFFSGAYVPKHDASGQIDGLIGYFRNVTENKRAEENLRRSEEALRLANEHLEQRVRERTMDLQNLTEQLERSRHELRKLASELVMSEERERKRIAGVLHDDIAQTLAAARMRLDLLQSMQSDQKDKQTLQEVKAFLVQSIQETRALMTDIGNPLLFDLGLKAACEALVNRLMERHPVRIRCDIPDAYKHLDPDVKAILYQLIRELLNNVAKHGRAQNARVMISMEEGHFRVQVTDDGVGFDPQALGAPTAEGGFGLYSIRERLIAIDGSLRIESAPGAGTVVTAILPSTFD
jgi:PAS domain S-box-containing protein